MRRPPLLLGAALLTLAGTGACARASARMEPVPGMVLHYADTTQLRTASAQPLPVIDMHLHALPAGYNGPPPLGMCTPIDPMPTWDPSGPYGNVFMALFKDPPCADPVWSPRTDEELKAATVEEVRRLNVYGVLSGPVELVADWILAAPGRFWPGVFPTDDAGWIAADSLRRLHAAGKLAVVGEIGNQYEGIEPADERMAPYWALAEELDLPVGIHIGTGPPGAIYLGAQGYRARLHSALTLEEVLVRHPKLRVYIMHAGYPLLDDLLAVLYAHPHVYVDVGVIVYTQPRAAFYRYLQAIFDAGFGPRVMFGSDQMEWPGVIERSILVINEAPFLSAAQKRDVLYNNAARFLRLPPEEIARHHAAGN
jgi:predicted TIM-barrel fold metal-dependent hydrolase